MIAGRNDFPSPQIELKEQVLFKRATYPREQVLQVEGLEHTEQLEMQGLHVFDEDSL